MRAVVVGTGTTGSAVNKLLKQDAHQVVTVGRKSAFADATVRGETSPPAQSIG